MIKAVIYPIMSNMWKLEIRQTARPSRWKETSLVKSNNRSTPTVQKTNFDKSLLTVIQRKQSQGLRKDRKADN